MENGPDKNVESAEPRFIYHIRKEQCFVVSWSTWKPTLLVHTSSTPGDKGGKIIEYNRKSGVQLFVACQVKPFQAPSDSDLGTLRDSASEAQPASERSPPAHRQP